jgi:hypothetical protein
MIEQWRPIKNKVVVYSSIYGNYDEPKVQPLKDKPILFTDKLESEDWEVRKVERKEVHPRMQAKYFKCMPHEVLDCDVSIWIDGSATIKIPNFEKWCLDQLGNADIALIKHPERDCIYDEANFCQFMQKYQGVPVLEQVEEYRKQGYPAHSGLWACGLLIRRHNNKVRQFNKLWWKHNKKYTYQDQLSFPVCAREVGLDIRTINISNLLDNSVVVFSAPHKSIL